MSKPAFISSFSTICASFRSLAIALALSAGTIMPRSLPLALPPRSSSNPRAPRQQLPPLLTFMQPRLRTATTTRLMELTLTRAHGLPTDAPRFRLGPLLVTNSMILTWFVTLALIIFARIATWRMKEIPDGAQNVWEWWSKACGNFLEGIIGRDLVKKTFWFLPQFSSSS
jgi:hypothetical protein